ncbi:MAG: glycosyltransferase family 1 protein [Candidatus Abyssobacteria bacterium SURF_5]|uniref:Glycosyltransferase family 1 protein n=1 Tax=Abyssobacteria bacterium (strain SURF_5) TaxID=2093360 RepID=A0A3A4P2D1_ABYX5|nr:MAG: glycosyltransferase family 1 protein [Candidatus Abyssubacteria bacterium SURF_5]
MRIAIDASSAAIEQKTGVAKYITRLIENLEALDDDNEYVVYYRLSRWKRRANFYRPRKRTTKVKFFQEPFFRGRGIDVFHGLDARLPEIRGPKLIVTIHDLFSLVSDEFADERFRKKKIARYRDIAERADGIICVSESTRQDFIRFFPEAEPKTHVVYHGVDEQFFPRTEEEIERIKKKYGIRADYLLHVGEISKRKNLLRMFKAFRSARERLGEDLQFVAAGKLSHGHEDVIRYLNENGCSDQILLTGYVPDEDLPALYSGAKLLLFTTLYEGFGLPILEALACGTPVVTSDVSSMNEIGGADTVRANPRSEGAIAEKIVDVLSRPYEVRQESGNSVLLMQTADWRETARATLAVYRAIREF